MAKDTDLKSLKKLKEDIIGLNTISSLIKNNRSTINANEEEIKNPKKYQLKNAKSTNNESKLKSKFKNRLEEKCAVEDFGDIMFSFFENIGLKIFIIIILIVAADFIGSKVAPDIEMDDSTIALIVIGIILLVGVVPQIVRIIIRIIRLIRLKRISLSGKQKKQLQDARELDKENEEYNKKMIEKEKDVYEEKQQVYLTELKKKNELLIKETGELETKASKLQDKINDDDCLGPNEKVLNTINMLIYFIETKRADNIKEALHEFDKLVANQQLLMIEQEKMRIQQQAAEQEMIDRQLKMIQDSQHQQSLEASMRATADASAETARQVEYGNYRMDYYNRNK